MGCEAQAFACAQRVGEFKFAGLAIDRLRYQRLIGETHNDIASQRCNGRICAIDLAIRPDCFDAIKGVGTS